MWISSGKTAGTVGSGVRASKNLLAHLLANYSVRGRIRLYAATNSCPKVLDFPHYKVRGRTRTHGAIRSFEPVGNPASQITRRHFDQHFVAGELATILLPNCSVRRSTRQHQGAGRCSIMADLMDTLLLSGTRCYRHCRTPKPGGGHTMPAHRGKFVAYYRVTTHKQGKSGPGMRNLP
jgi:hypothetical protein